MTDLIVTRVENLKPKEEKKNSSAATKKFLKKAKKRKRKDSNSSVVKYSKESTRGHHLIKKYCISHGKGSHSTDSFKDLGAMVNKHKQIRRKYIELWKEQQRAKCSY